MDRYEATFAYRYSLIGALCIVSTSLVKHQAISDVVNMELVTAINCWYTGDSD